jgi:hypothetical protein
MTMTRNEVLSRYRHLRAISTQHHSAALKFLARSTILEHARRLGLAKGKALLVQNEAELTLVFDLAIYTAREGRSRAIDLYAQATQLPEGSDEALTLEAMQRARFSVWQIKERHETAGLLVTDLLRKVEAWLVDERLEATAQNGMACAARLYDLDSFAMTAGVVVPVDLELLDEILTDSLNLGAERHTQPACLADDLYFATAIYRAAIDQGVMNQVMFE